MMSMRMVDRSTRSIQLYTRWIDQTSQTRVAWPKAKGGTIAVYRLFCWGKLGLTPVHRDE